ncbi:hypothetical protein [Streptomyces smaragdinus]|uniref:hypothetical protein n=1 Tax=Streptomyces smaragdinus TaxID=2585196 RepID=UPI00188654A9|nr:hypothetical protein [Streptomyces smaragdinus]
MPAFAPVRVGGRYRLRRVVAGSGRRRGLAVGLAVLSAVLAMVGSPSGDSPGSTGVSGAAAGP